MNRILFFFTFIVLSTFVVGGSAFAQEYSSDAALVSTKYGVATVKCSGVAAKKKVAIAMAAKSVIHTYLISGIDGLNDGRPLIGTKKSSQIDDYLDKIFNQGRYTVFIKSCTLDEKASKNLAKTYTAAAVVEFYYESLYKDLVVNKIIGKGADKTTLIETQEEIVLPSIMVMPYRSNEQSYLEIMQKNSDMRMAISRVAEGFGSKGVQTVDFETSLKNANEYEARNGDLSLDDAILNNSGADVVVKVDISKDQTAEGLKISLMLTAVDASTGRILASKPEISGRKRASTDAICTAMVELMINDFLKAISTSMAYKINKGNSVALNFTIDSGSAINMDTEIGDTYLPLSDVLILWLKDNAKNGKYHQKGRSSTMLSLDEIMIQNKS
ncbi:MAG: DUF6175 family protein, partial [Bacteroidales bacterium]